MKDHSPNEKQKSNKGILHIIYFFSVLFFLMLGYMVYFIGWQAPDLMGNPYNARMDVFNNRFVRGSILSADGQILAETQVNEDGSEKRVYPYSSLFAHVVGYSTKGKTGLESAANFYLMESNMNPVQQVVNEITEVKSLGDNVVTTLDTGLQQVAAEALGNKAGAVVCMDPATGRILAMVSNPGFDPNSLAEDWDSLVSSENKSGNLVNRGTQGLYPPGSTFKIIMALEYIKEHPEDYGNFSYICDGVFTDPDNAEAAVHCYGGEVHGEVSLRTAFAESCNAAFAKIGTEINKESLRNLADNLYFNQDLPISISSSRSRFKVNAESDTWTMMQSAIGQGETQMTPLHNLLITAAIANGGVVHEPILLSRVESADGNIVKEFKNGDEKRLMSENEAQILKEYMRTVVEEGTASKLRTDAYQAAGKTGSAEYVEDGETKTHAWFTGFAPLEDPKIAITVLVEDGETGGRTAAPIARSVLDYWLGA